MCGFVGIYKPDGLIEHGKSVIGRMCDVIAHRGPNHYGYYEDPHVRFGHRRLSIIDLSDKANQPMEVGSCVIVYNGEVYNYLEIKKELGEEHNVEFKTNSDTEVILRAYQHYGPDCVRKFNGMFAFVIWDKLKKVLFVARDRLGVKPLFYVKDRDGSYFFSSDIKSLWEMFPPDVGVSHEAVYHYFIHGYMNGPRTSSLGIHKFPSASYLIISDDHLQFVRYWDLNDVKKENIDFREAVEGTEQLLKDAVRIRLRSDVPLGCFLSGGVDSSLITALTTREYHQPIHSFSIGVNSKQHDESMYAARVARQYSTKHHHKILNSGALDELPQIVWKYSEIFGDSSSVPCYFVSKEASNDLKVVLTGDGGDEAFGGYVIPYAVYIAERYRKIPKPVRAGLARFLTALGRDVHGSKLLRFYKFNQLSLMPFDQIYREFIVTNGWPAIIESMRETLDARWEESMTPILECKSDDYVDKVLYTEINERLINDYLVKVDMGTMAHSLEARSPFLDYRLMEFGYSLENNVKFYGYQRKAILKRIAEKYFDKELVYRRKGGFTIPLEVWMSEQNYSLAIKRILLRKSILQEYLDSSILENLWKYFTNNPGIYYRNIWLLLWFQIWEGIFISKCYDPNEKLSQL